MSLTKLIPSKMDAAREPNVEKHHADQLEHGSIAGSHHQSHHSGLGAAGFATDAHELPKGYFTSPYFLGTMTAVGFNLMASTGGFSMVAPVLNQINAAVGPSESIIWLSLMYTTGLAVGLLIVGTLSDIFGRRWFFVGGTALGAIGCIVSPDVVLLRSQH